MTVRRIFCEGCKQYMGEIRDATLRKGIVYLCTRCETKRLASDLAQKNSRSQYDTGGSDALDFLNSILSKK